MDEHMEEHDVRPSELAELRRRLEDMDVADVVEELGRLSTQQRAVSFRLLHKDRAVDVFEDLDPSIQAELVDGLRAEKTAELFNELDPDDRAPLLDELPAGVAARLMSGLSPRERALTTTVLGYPESSAGRRMSPEVASVHEGSTAVEALNHLRDVADRVETIYSVPVLATRRRVVGVVSLRQLIVADPQSLVADIMSEPTMVHATDHQEEAANVVRDGGYVGVPVVDAEERLLGIFTVDDAMRVLEHEEDEDSALTGGSLPLRRPYLTVPVQGLVKARILWLLVLVVAATLTVQVMSSYEDVLLEVATLALFVPLLIGTGGNAGSQSATTIVRALAVGDVRPNDIARVVGKEISTGALMGLGLAAIGFLPGAYFFGIDIAIVLCVTVTAICVLATAAGSAIPLIAKKVGVDPAVMSAPFISTFVDATGLITYFTVAKIVLGL